MNLSMDVLAAGNVVGGLSKAAVDVDPDRLVEGWVTLFRQRPFSEYIDFVVTQYGRDDRRDDEGSPPVQSAIGVLAEQAVTALRLAKGGYRFHDIEVDRASTALLSIETMRAIPYLWLNSTRDQAEAMDLPPRFRVSRALLPQPVWFCLETAQPIYGVDGATHPMDIDSILAFDVGSAVQVVALGSDTIRRGSVPHLESVLVPHGAVYPDAFGPEGKRPYVAESFLKLMTFLSSPYLPVRTLRLTRAERRRAGLKPQEEPVVGFVDLRTPMVRRGEDANHRLVDWQHRWLVRGHLRAQWYPSEEAHRVIWVAPYIKGPEGAPMKESAYRVRR